MASRYVGNNPTKENSMPGRRGTGKSSKTGSAKGKSGKNAPGSKEKFPMHRRSMGHMKGKDK